MFPQCSPNVFYAFSKELKIVFHCFPRFSNVCLYLQIFCNVSNVLKYFRMFPMCSKYLHLPMFSIAFPMLSNVFETILIFQCFTILLPSCYHSAISDLGPRFFEHQEIAKYLYFALMGSRALKRCCFSCLYSGCLPIQFQSPAAAASAAAAGFRMELE